MIRFLRTGKRVCHRKELVGRWVVELSFEQDFARGDFMRKLQFGIYKVLALVSEGELLVHSGNILGWMRCYLVFWPIERKDGDQHYDKRRTV